MQRAGLAVAKQALALSPHARTIWVACGPGNNGGDGFEAAAHLVQFGKRVVATRLVPDRVPSKDAAIALSHAKDAGVVFTDQPPPSADLCIDALFGIGQLNTWDARCSRWITAINSSGCPILAVDIPSGLDADTGSCVSLHVHASQTLTLLALKPGLFTADGREASGDIWFNALGVSQPSNPCAELNIYQTSRRRAHNTHKGSFGDVSVVGGARSMEGAAILAARAAIRSGAGRVYVALTQSKAITFDPVQPELMFRDPANLDLPKLTVVAGCGGGGDIAPLLPELTSRAAKLVLDADAINALASDQTLQKLVKNRPGGTTVMTPHPLEAARLLNVPSSSIQSDRLSAAQSLADQYSCVIVLKGSGTIIAAPRLVPKINPTGNGRLASAGTGDVLAGMIGAHLAQGRSAFDASCFCAFQHGEIADTWRFDGGFTAQSIINCVS